MANYDPTQKRETWLLQQVATDPGNKPVYRRARMNLVSYDGNPERLIEPVNMSDHYNPIDKQVYSALADGAGLMASIEYVSASRMYEVHSFDDVDFSRV